MMNKILLIGLALLTITSCKTLNCKAYPESDTSDVLIGWDSMVTTDTFPVYDTNRTYFIINGYDAVYYLPVSPTNEITIIVSGSNNRVLADTASYMESDFKVGDMFHIKYPDMDVKDIATIVNKSPKGYLEVRYKGGGYDVYTPKELEKIILDVYIKK